MSSFEPNKRHLRELLDDEKWIHYDNSKKRKSFLSENCIIDKCDAVNFLRKIYNKKSNIECKLIVYALDNSEQYENFSC
ncbi:hypothetical protein ALC53_08238 [Atta colombica]|uniref:Uncharacterized protein n=1 Tax=Atta colombica TaxID=520822 RepID=A0A151I3A5_9HYME|nr:hypothetical protein ALC53_08238 [Atta colombica]